MVLLPSPNNPTGTALPLDVVEALCEAAGDGLVVVDEAYAEFRRAGTPSALELLPSLRNLVVTRTMSKAFAFAGARLGYLAAAPGDLRRDPARAAALPPVAVTQAAALAALRHTDELLGRVDALRAERDATGRLAARAGPRGRRERRQLRALRPLRRPARRLAGPARPGRADPRDRAGRLAARLGRHSRGDGSIQGCTDLARRGTTDGVEMNAARARTALVERETKESKVHVEVDLDGTGRSDIATGVGFFDHMLTAFARHSLIDLVVHTAGDTHIDAHHTVEDTAIVLGDALREALGDKAGIRRFGDATVPLDEALVQAVVDLSGRPYCVHTGEPDGQAYAVIGGDSGPAYAAR